LILSSIDGTSRGGTTGSDWDLSEPLSCCPFGAKAVDRNKSLDLKRRKLTIQNYKVITNLHKIASIIIPRASLDSTVRIEALTYRVELAIRRQLLILGLIVNTLQYLNAHNL